MALMFSASSVSTVSSNF